MRAADFLREMLSHDLVVARKIEDMVGIREETRNTVPESSDDAEARIGI